MVFSILGPITAASLIILIFDDDDNRAPRDSRRGNGESFYDIRGCANVTLDGADRGACGIEETCRNFADAMEAG